MENESTVEMEEAENIVFIELMDEGEVLISAELHRDTQYDC